MSPDAVKHEAPVTDFKDAAALWRGHGSAGCTRRRHALPFRSMGAQLKPRMTYAEYLAAEQSSEVKHEFLRGEVFAMAGGTFEHALLASNVLREIGRLLGGRCVVVGSDARVRIVESDRAAYPDVMVVCGPRERAHDDADATTNPTVIVEVLSDSTEADDRGAKFAHYRRLASLRDYVLVSQREPRIEVFSRDGDEWRFAEAGHGASARLRSIDVLLAVDDVYRGVFVSD